MARLVILTETGKESIESGEREGYPAWLIVIFRTSYLCFICHKKGFQTFDKRKRSLIKP